MISFIVPAHNEQREIGRTLQASQDAGRIVGQPYEIIVVDDASTDATATIARELHATVLRVNHRQISATRNSGARVANGEQLFFVDADTIIKPRAVASALSYWLVRSQRYFDRSQYLLDQHVKKAPPHAEPDEKLRCRSEKKCPLSLRAKRRLKVPCSASTRLHIPVNEPT
jgi:glycosyltransferase involved in cell wall biosynthesis